MLERLAIRNAEPPLPQASYAWQGRGRIRTQAFRQAHQQARQVQETLNINPTTATRSAKNMIAVVFHPSSQP